MIRRILSAIARPLSALLHGSGLMRRQAILKVDGGVASQIHFYMIGEWLRRHRGVDVVYDLIWFEEDGKDCDGRFVRNFDLLKLAPGLKFPIAQNGIKNSLYRLLYTHINDPASGPQAWQNLRSPIYMAGYYGVGDGFYKDMSELIAMNPLDVGPFNKALAREIETTPEAVGMHVRRGDLSVYVESYGAPASDEYFIKAVRIMHQRYGSDVPIYIFSDEPGWVEHNLLPKFPSGKYKILTHNGSDKGYLDLWLISKCRHFITSKGSFGKFGAMLSRRRGDVVICQGKETDWWLGQIPDAIML